MQTVVTHGGGAPIFQRPPQALSDTENSRPNDGTGCRGSFNQAVGPGRGDCRCNVIPAGSSIGVNHISVSSPAVPVHLIFRHGATIIGVVAARVPDPLRIL